MKLKKQLLVLAAVATAIPSFGQGSIQLNNSIATKVIMCLPDGTIGDVPAGSPVVFGVFLHGSLVSGDLGFISPSYSGIISAPFPYILQGPPEGATVPLQILAWDARFGRDWEAARAAGGLYGATDIREVTLGPTAGPGTVIWQSRSGTSPNRFYPLRIGALTCVPEPSAWALLGLGTLALICRLKAWAK